MPIVSDNSIYTGLPSINIFPIYEDESLNLAFEFAFYSHLGGVRQTKSSRGYERPYLSHPYGVECILNKIGCSISKRRKGILHDIFEEKEGLGLKEVRDKFGREDVEDLIILSNMKHISEDGGHLPAKEQKKSNQEYMDCLFEHAKKKKRDDVIIVKQADKLHCSSAPEIVGLLNNSDAGFNKLYSICDKNILLLKMTRDYLDDYPGHDNTSFDEIKNLYDKLYKRTKEGIDLGITIITSNLELKLDKLFNQGISLPPDPGRVYGFDIPESENFQPQYLKESPNRHIKKLIERLVKIYSLHSDFHSEKKVINPDTILKDTIFDVYHPAIQIIEKNLGD